MPRIWVVGTWSEASRVFYICFDLPLCVPEGDPRIPDDGSCIRHLDLLVSFFFIWQIRHILQFKALGLYLWEMIIYQHSSRKLCAIICHHIELLLPRTNRQLTESEHAAVNKGSDRERANNMLKICIDWCLSCEFWRLQVIASCAINPHVYLLIQPCCQCEISSQLLLY